MDDSIFCDISVQEAPSIETIVNLSKIVFEFVVLIQQFIKTIDFELSMF